MLSGSLTDAWFTSPSKKLGESETGTWTEAAGGLRRVENESWHAGISMRIELFGAKLSAEFKGVAAANPGQRVVVDEAIGSVGVVVVAAKADFIDGMASTRTSGRCRSRPEI